MIEGARFGQRPLMMGRLFKLLNGRRKSSCLHLRLVLAGSRRQLHVRAESSENWSGFLSSAYAAFCCVSFTSNSVSVFLAAHGEDVVFDWANGTADDGTTTER